jgi:hypothetical protein
MAKHEKIEAPDRTGRLRVLITGILVTSDGPQRVTIRDISRSGAQITCKDRIPKDADVCFKRGSLFAAAHVIWVSGDEAGLSFYRELSPDEVEGALPTALLRDPD